MPDIISFATSTVMLNLVYSIFIITLLGIICLVFVKNTFLGRIQYITLVTSLLIFLIICIICILFDTYQTSFQAVFIIQSTFFNVTTIFFGIDAISLFFILLTSFLFPFCILVNWNSILLKTKEYAILFLLLEILLITVFYIFDTIGFYILFESVLIPMFLYIGIWGSRERKIYAAYLLFLYTLVGSLVMLFGILHLYYTFGSSDVQFLWNTAIPSTMQKVLWLAFFASFSVKIPMFPFHIWLPEAHVEAPTAGSVLLAGVLLKLGGYGFIRFTLPLCPVATTYYNPLVYTLSLMGILYISLTTLRQTDMKRVIAYSSVAHMSLVVLGIFAQNVIALEGAIFLMLSHGVVSGGLFLCVGQLYGKHKTRLIKYYGGLVQVMPLFSAVLCVFTLANLSLPLTSSFVGEFLILLGFFYQNIVAASIAGLTVVFGAGYSLWFYNRVVFGNLNIKHIYFFTDVSVRDFMLYVPLIIFIVLGGIVPSVFFDSMHSAVSSLAYKLHW